MYSASPRIPLSPLKHNVLNKFQIEPPSSSSPPDAACSSTPPSSDTATLFEDHPTWSDASSSSPAYLSSRIDVPQQPISRSESRKGSLTKLHEPGRVYSVLTPFLRSKSHSKYFPAAFSPKRSPSTHSSDTDAIRHVPSPRRQPSTRISKRNHSELNGHVSFPSCSPKKKFRTGEPSLIHGYAAQPASTRRAFSLNSVGPVANADLSTHSFPVPSFGAVNEEPGRMPQDWVPTAPSTPVGSPARQTHPVSKPNSLPFPVPAIAPPVDHTWCPSLSQTAAAKFRIKRMLEREKLVPGCGSLPSDGNADLNARAQKGRWQEHFPLHKNLRKDIIQWLLEVIPDPDTYPPSYKKSSNSFRLPRSSTFDSGSNSCYSSSYTDSSCSSISSSSYIDDSTPDLIDQLTTSPTTRFHAAHLFLRYFNILGGDWKVEESQNRELCTWDVGVACLALSVKFHRDFLPPLQPIYAIEYEILAPHEMGYEQLEVAQRDLLTALDFTLGGSPQAIVDELWEALPSLRELFVGRRMQFWQVAQRETWLLLFEAIQEPDVLRFPISLLTSSALIHGIIAALERMYEFGETWYTGVGLRTSRMDGVKRPEYNAHTLFSLRNQRFKEAKTEGAGVFLDIQDVMELSSVKFAECLDWMADLAPPLVYVAGD